MNLPASSEKALRIAAFERVAIAKGLFVLPGFQHVSDKN